jgi:outer membrane protein assembly factor BamB
MARGDAPTEWSDTKNIKWKTEIPGRGHSTPIVWGDRIFLTTAIPTGPAVEASRPPEPRPDQGQGGGRGRRGGPGGGAGAQVEHRFVLLCIDRRNGKIIWEKTAKVAAPHEGYHRTYGSFASQSPVTDGRHVYVSFGSRGVYCYDLNGKLVWEKDPGVRMQIRLQFGEGSAPTLHGDKLILNYDHEGDSFIVALDKRTGKELWRTPREEQSSWSSPFVAEQKGRTQIVMTASQKVRSYDVNNGKLIWECAGLGSNTIPMPVQQGDAVLVMSGHRNPKLMAIRLGREGDLTGSDAVLWSHTRALSYTPSPVLHDNKLYVLTDQGMLSCFNATTGEPYYHQVRVPNPDSFKASPVGANGKLYLASESGVVTIVKMGEKFEVLATNTLEDQVFIASPVMVGGDIFLRSQNRLYCISARSSR